MKKILFLMCFAFQFAAAQDIETTLKEAEKKEGFLTYYWHEAKGKMYLEVKNLQDEFVYYPSLSRGLGSNDIGLDRGKLGAEHLLKWVKAGNKLLLVEPNSYYRARSTDAQERQAVEQSFAKSVLFGFEIIKQIDGKYIIDFTPFLIRDAMEASASITATKQGTYSFDLSRSGVYTAMCKSFPENTEFEAMITLSGSNPGSYVREIAPNTDFLTMHQHHSFVKAPEPGFKMRLYDPRIGYNGISFFDYATPINSPIEKHYISRHRLEKKDPIAAISEAKKPIVYYLDPGTPEPIRAALFEGATWWNQAFEAAGYKDAFQVKMLPADADPMDVRYNLVQWVHRSTRGWSYGSSINDPRTGEIIKGKVTLGSLRVRQDYLLAQGLTADFDTDINDDALMKMSLDRLMQLSAHEIGHTLGLPHNYISSTKNRASVMDYPHPMAEEINGKITLSNAYAKGIGAYDKLSILYGYQDFPTDKNEEVELQKIVQSGLDSGLRFLTDQDARPDGSISPQTHLWDNGESASAELQRLIGIRRKVLQNFGANKIPKNTPMTKLEEVFVPMYMFHRYQVQATSKILGGSDYTYALKGDGQSIIKPVSAMEQNKALDALMTTLEPEFLKVPISLFTLIPPRAFRYDANPREVFKRRTGMAFDILTPAETSAQLTLSLVLDSKRVARLASQKIIDPSLPNLSAVLQKMSGKLLDKKNVSATNYEGQIARLVAEMYIVNLKKLLVDKNTGVEVKLIISHEFQNINQKFSSKNILHDAFDIYIENLIKSTDEEFEKNAPNYFIAPDGQPIDESQDWIGWEN
jgi:Met-zincin/Domain of unknown function (DUF5117)